MIVYGVSSYEDYMGGGVEAIFSTKTKAIKYAEDYGLNCTQTIEVIKLKIDNPEWYSNNEDIIYCRHGK